MITLPEIMREVFDVQTAWAEANPQEAAEFYAGRSDGPPLDVVIASSSGVQLRFQLTVTREPAGTGLPT